MTTAALIVAAGRGARASGTGGPPKQYVTVGGRSVLAWSIAAFARDPAIGLVQVVIHPDDASLYRDLVATELGQDGKLLPPASGGDNRQASVRAGLEALEAHQPATVLIHDAARPFVDADVISRVAGALATSPAAIAAIPVVDTLKAVGPDSRITGTVDRTGLWRAQTPQGFHFAAILQAHRRALAAHRSDFTDDAALAAWAGLDVVVVQGGERNVKLTSGEDIEMADTLISARGRTRETRTGQGFDVHRFAPGSSVWLCGVEIPHTARLEGHSDADVGLHALTDALLGAIGAGDIGVHFPPSDARWKDAASLIFLAYARDLLAKRGGSIVNVDVTILAEAPRVSTHRDAMCQRMAGILGIDPDRVSVKATTTEGLGFTGRREGIAAMATASVSLPIDERR